MKKNSLLAVVLVFSVLCFGQNSKDLQKRLIINVINPGVDYELPVGNKTLISLGVGVGYSGAYNEITVLADNGGFMVNNGFNYVIAPFFDTQFKYLYNRNARAIKGRPNEHNAGNFLSFRAIARGHSIAENLIRTDNLDFAVGPTWGFQRTFNKVRLLIDGGPQLYFDTKGNAGVFFPAMIQINLGFVMNKD